MSEFERWQGRFAADEYIFGTEPNAFLKSNAGLLRPGQKALAIADGEGRNGVWLAEQGLDVLSVDFSPNGLTKAERLAATRGVRLKTERVDLEHWQWPVRAFDVVAAIFIQFAGPAFREKIFAGIRGALKPAGLFILEGYGPKQLEYATGGPSELGNLYTPELLSKAFGDWDILSLRDYDSLVSEGTRHSGMSALVDLVARKPG